MRRETTTIVLSLALSAAAGLAGCGGGGDDAPSPDDVQACFKKSRVAVGKQPGVSSPVKAKLNIDIGTATPDPDRSGFVTFYESEDDAIRNGKAAKNVESQMVTRKGKVLYTPFALQANGGRSASESKKLIEDCALKGKSG